MAWLDQLLGLGGGQPQAAGPDALIFDPAAARRQGLSEGLAQAAAAFLGGPSAVPVGLGSRFGQALLGLGQGYDQGYDQNVRRAAIGTRMKAEDAATQGQRLDNLQRAASYAYLTGAGAVPGTLVGKADFSGLPGAGSGVQVAQAPAAAPGGGAPAAGAAPGAAGMPAAPASAPAIAGGGDPRDAGVPGAAALRQQLVDQARFLMGAPDMNARIQGSALLQKAIEAPPGYLWDPTFRHQFFVPGGPEDPASRQRLSGAEAAGKYPFESALSSQGYRQNSALSAQGYSQDLGKIGYEAALTPVESVDTGTGQKTWVSKAAAAQGAGAGQPVPAGLSPEQTKHFEGLAGYDQALTEASNDAQRQNVDLVRMQQTMKGFSPSQLADAKAAAQSWLAALGWATPDAEKALSSWQEFSKIATQLSTSQARQLGAREAASVINMVVKNNPNASMTPRAIGDMLGGMKAMNDYVVAKNQAKEAWRSQRGTVDGFDAAWQREHPPQTFLPQVQDILARAKAGAITRDQAAAELRNWGFE
jgi:hypothetical protein